MAIRKIVENRVGTLARKLGFEIRRLSRAAPATPSGEIAVAPDTIGAHYGCGARLVPGWINLDAAVPRAEVPGAAFLRVDLAGRQPFADETFALGYAEDFLEHLPQAASIVFLAEARRTLRRGGVLRLAFPGLEGVLRVHYGALDVAALARAQWEAYEMWGHVHFYSRDEVRVVAEHVGFRDVRFFSFGQSSRPELAAMDSRPEETPVSTYVELTR